MVKQDMGTRTMTNSEMQGSDDRGRDRKSRWLGPTLFGRLLRRCRSSSLSCGTAVKREYSRQFGSHLGDPEKGLS